MPNKVFGRQSKGFTLIELLITVSLVALLTVVGVATYTNFLKSSRDSKRIADLKAIQSALGQYFYDRGLYPETLAMNTVLDNGAAFTSDIGAPSLSSQKIYFNNTPKDLLFPDHKYCYQGLKKGQQCDGSAIQECSNSTTNKTDWCLSYCLFAKLENTTAFNIRCTINSDYNFSATPQ